MLRLGNKSTVHHHLGRIMGGCVRYFGVPAGGTEFDIVGIGGPNASTLIRGVHTTFPSLKMALGCNNTNPMSPLVYMNMILDQLESFKGSCAISSLDKAVYLYPNSILKIHPHNNTIICENGTEYKYKVLALSTGLVQKPELIEGLTKSDPEDCSFLQKRIYAQVFDKVQRINLNRNFPVDLEIGDYLFYSPKWPYKGEGSDFFTFLVEHFTRQSRYIQRGIKGSRIKYFSANPNVYRFDYANQYIHEEAARRGNIDLYFGWELLKVEEGPKRYCLATFRNPSGDIVEIPFGTICVTPPCIPNPLIAESGLGDENGLLDVNQYTLQHKKYPNIFGMGDGTNLETTRTIRAIVRQIPVVKNNMVRYLQGQELNGIYDGFSKIQVYLGNQFFTEFTHIYDYEPHWINDMWPKWGIFAFLRYKYHLFLMKKLSEQIYGTKGNAGPPYFSFNKLFDPLDKNSYIQKKEIPLGEVKMFEPQRINDDTHALSPAFGGSENQGKLDQFITKLLQKVVPQQLEICIQQYLYHIYIFANNVNSVYRYIFIQFCISLFKEYFQGLLTMAIQEFFTFCRARGKHSRFSRSIYSILLDIFPVFIRSNMIYFFNLFFKETSQILTLSYPLSLFNPN